MQINMPLHGNLFEANDHFVVVVHRTLNVCMGTVTLY